MKSQWAFILTALCLQQEVFAQQKKYQFRKTEAPKYTINTEESSPKVKKFDLKKYNQLEFDKSQNDLTNAIQGIDLLLSSDIPEEKKRELYFKKSLISYTIAKSMTLKRKTSETATSLEIKYYKEAESLLNILIKNEKSSTDIQARSYYLLGLIDFEKEDYPAQKEKFLKSFQINQNTTYSATIALNIAEQYFEEENYPLAVKYYRIKFNEMNNQQKTITKYKLAWSYIGLKNNKTAIDLFKSIINENYDQNFVKDSMRDLALITTMDWSESQVIDFAKSSFKSKIIQRDYMFLAFKFFFNKNKNDLKLNLFEECLTHDHTIENRLLLHSYSTTSARKDYASASFTNSISRFQKDLIQYKISPLNKEFQEFSKDLENNNEYFIRVLTETLTNKLKNTENLTASAMREQIHYHIRIHSQYFKSSAILPTLMDLLIDISLDEKKISWLEEVLQLLPQIQDQKSKEKIEYRARKEQLILAEKLALEDEMIRLQLDPLYDIYIQKYPRDEISLLIYKKRAQENFSQKKYDPAIVYFKKTLELEPNEENNYKLLFTYFSKKDFNAIIKIPLEDSNSSPRILDIYKETQLGLAQEAKTKNDFSQFEAATNAFFKLNKDATKNKLVKIELMTFAYDKMSKEDFYTYFEKQSSELISFTEMIPFRLNLIDYFLNKGDFEKCQRLTTPANDESLVLLHSLFLASDSKNLTPEFSKDIAKLKPENKDYILSLLMLSQPELAIQYFKNLPQTTEDEKKLLFLAYQINQGTEEPQLSSNELKLVGKSLSYANKNPLTSVEQKYTSLDFPKAKQKANQYGAKLEKLIADLKKLRKELLSQSKDKTLVQQSRMFKLAQASENSTALSIEESPLPKGLTTDEQAQYKSELSNLASEYKDQAIEYEKLAKVIDEKIIESEKNKWNEYLPTLDLKKWPLPKVKETELIASIFSKHGLTLTLLYLDKLKKLKTLDDEDYYSFRGFYLIQASQKEFIRKYVKSEWKQFNQSDLIQKWERLADHLTAK